jgi:predicted CopG family antitoxin
MAAKTVKTITIDLEAYDKLAREKREGESFSQVIKRALASSRMTASALLRTIEKTTLSDDTLDQIEKIVSDRDRESSFRRPGRESR